MEEAIACEVAIFAVSAQRQHCFPANSSRDGGVEILPDNLPAILLSSISQKSINPAPFFSCRRFARPIKSCLITDGCLGRSAVGAQSGFISRVISGSRVRAREDRTRLAHPILSPFSGEIERCVEGELLLGRISQLKRDEGECVLGFASFLLSFGLALLPS